MKAKKRRAKINTKNQGRALEKRLSSGSPIPHTAKLDLSTLLAETPEKCIDRSWENLPSVGRENR